LRGAITVYRRNEMEDKALPLLETLVAVEPGDVQARVDLAAVHAATGNREKAEAEFSEALRRKPDFAPALMGLGNLYAKAGEDTRGIPLLERAVAAHPAAYEPHFLLGSAYNRLGRFPEAMKELERALQTGGADQPEVHYQKARSLSGLGRADDRRAALRRFADLTRQGKEDVEAQRKANWLVNEARDHLESGDLKSAVNSLEQARTVKPGDATLLFRLAGLHFDLQQLDPAREYVQAAISISPSVWLHHYLLGLIESKSARWDDARRSLETAAQLNPAGAEIHDALGTVLLEQGNAKRAVASFERAHQLAPREEAYRRNLETARTRPTASKR
jgi:tetratricopeptide (TPR) repeat protein